MAEVKFDVSKVDPNDPDSKLQATADDADLNALDARALTKVQSAMGVQSLDLGTLSGEIKKRIHDPEVSSESKTEQVTFEILGTPIAVIPMTTHRYTVDVPDQGEATVLNLGHRDPSRKLPDNGISGRTASHIHFHTDGAVPSMVAIGIGTKAELGALEDPKKALSSNIGVAAVTNGNIWVDAKKQLNLVSRTHDAVLRSEGTKVRVQADHGPIEMGSGNKVTIAAAKGVQIVADPSTKPLTNGYEKPFEGELVGESAKVTLKNLVSLLDITSSITALVKSASKLDESYPPGKRKSAQFANDGMKYLADSVKLGSSAARFALGFMKVDGQVKITADTMFSAAGYVSASMYGKLSSSVSSAVSASLLAGTTSVKGLAWTSIYAGLGVGIRTVRGKLSLASDKGGVSVQGKKDVSLKSDAAVTIGGDTAAELKSGKGDVYVSAAKTAKLCAGPGAGHGITASENALHMGTMKATDTGKAQADGKLGVTVTRGQGTVVFSEKAEVHVQNNGEVHVKGSRILLG